MCLVMVVLIGTFPVPSGLASAVVFTTPMFWWQTHRKRAVPCFLCVKLLYRQRSSFQINFLGWNIPDLQKIQKERDSVHHHPVSCNICTLHAYMIHLLKLRNLIGTLLLSKAQAGFAVHQLFPWGPFSVPGSSPGYQRALCCHVSPVLTHLWQFPSLSLSWPWQF